MTVLDYTSYSQIRAILGVSEDEITDEELALPIWGMLLNQKFLDISELITAKYSEIFELASGSRTANQVKFFELAKLFAAYAVAQELLVALPMFGFQTITDGKASQQRFDKWDDLKTGIEKSASVMKAKLRLAFATLESSYSAPQPVQRLFIVASGIATDPVTG